MGFLQDSHHVREEMPITISRPPINKIQWFATSLTSCFFISVTIQDEAKTVQEVRLGHFSTNFLPRSIYQICRLSPDELSRATIWTAGLAQKVSFQSLQTTTERLVRNLTDLGWTLDLRWLDRERPVIHDQRTNEDISDLGRCTFEGKDAGRGMFRGVCFGVSGQNAILLSSLFTREEEVKYWGTTCFVK
jgi:hypothetical protein